MRNRIFAVIAIAVLAGGGLAYGTYNLMQQSASATTVAAADAAGRRGRGRSSPWAPRSRRKISTTLNFPEGTAPEGSFSKPDELLERGLIVPIVKNEPILAAKLAPKEAGSGLPPVIPEGMRAVSVRVNEVVGVAGYVLPGTRVDVVATASPTSDTAQMTSKVVLSNMQVLTAGTRMEQDQKDGKPMQVTVVTLLVTPEQSERLALASTEGKIHLALRNPLDTSAPSTPGIRTAGLLGGVAAPPATRAASSSAPNSSRPQPQVATMPVTAAQPTVEIIRGDKRTTEIIK